MTCKYQLTITAKCPRDESLTDVYEMTVVAADMIAVEEILGAVAQETTDPIYQEPLAENLARLLDADVTLVGTHSGVSVEVIA